MLDKPPSVGRMAAILGARMRRHLPRLLGFFLRTPGVRLFPSLVLPLTIVLFAAAGCKGLAVGRICIVDSAGQPGTIVQSLSLECESRVCLHVEGKAPDMCTADCTLDSDCEAVSETPCRTGFACMVPVVTGNFCCRRLCVCRDYLEDGVSPADPPACDASNAANECCNLEGRPACR